MAKISSKWSLVKQDLYKLLMGALLAAVGAGATYLIEALKLVDFGDYNMLAAAGLAVLANLIRKFFTKTAY